MSVKGWVLIGSLLLCAASARASTEESTKRLLVYGPGGPHHVIEECAKLFEERHGIDVAVFKAMPLELGQKLRENGDIYYGGAEYMLEGFNRRHPGVLDMTSAEKLHPRRMGVLVRKGNPLNIKGTEDLRQKEVAILDVKLENMRHFHGAPAGLSSNIRKFEYTGQQGAAAWLSTPEIDAWVTYRSWHFFLEAESDFIEIPGDAGLRFTPVALTRQTQNREAALQFISFLKSEEARRVFEKHGWY
jgi:accessory colonization factor AcfC